MDALRRLLGEVRDAVYLLDGEGRVVFHNGRLPPGVGRSEAHLYNERVPEPLQLTFPLTGNDARTERVQYTDKLHHRHVVRRRVVPINGRWACLLMAEANPHESTRLEFLGRLVLLTAHDLNNMLTAIAGHADLVARNGNGPETIENLRLAVRQASRFTHRLLAFGDAGPARPRVVELNERVADLTRTLRRLLPVEIGLDFLPAVGEVTVEVDPRHLDQALIALTAGVYDILEPGGAIHLRVNADGSVSLDASGLRSPQLEPSFGALEFARTLLDVETSAPGRFRLSAIV
ncbi:MAG: nitrogen regulation protein NR(II) [Planctomycetota bacterium]|jgi:signal transduction histidine kinase